MKKYIDSNKQLWDELADLHIKSEFYGVDDFKKGKANRGMRSLEIEEIGDVRGKKLLHLQCHFGIDTISWERLGAQVVGIDFSERAISLARNLANEMGMNAEFVQSDIYKLCENYEKKAEFDIVYTSHGTIYWLPDLNEWARTIAYYLKEGGIFYIMDGHPTSQIFDNNEPSELKLGYSYFHKSEPMMFEDDGSYATDENVKHNTEYGWQHPLSDIINSLVSAGLEIEFLHEFNFNSWKQFSWMEKRGEWWYLPNKDAYIPLMFSLRARKK